MFPQLFGGLHEPESRRRDFALMLGKRRVENAPLQSRSLNHAAVSLRYVDLFYSIRDFLEVVQKLDSDGQPFKVQKLSHDFLDLAPPGLPVRFVRNGSLRQIQWHSAPVTVRATGL
jgi:hypothetical protein